jgi:hypothetical protein
MNNNDYQNNIYISFTNNDIHISYDNNHDITSNIPHIKINVSMKLNNIDKIDIIYNNKNHNFTNTIDDIKHINNINNSINSIGNNFLFKLHNYIDQLPLDYLHIINTEYTYLKFDMIGCLIAGISSYIAFSILSDDPHFSSLLPCQIPISSTTILNNTMSKLYRSILTPLSKLSTGLIKNLINFIISFLNLWENILIDDNNFSITSQFSILIDTLSSLLSNLSEFNNFKSLEHLDQKILKLEHLDQKILKLEHLDQKILKLEHLDQKILKLEHLDQKILKLEQKFSKLEQLEQLEQKFSKLDQKIIKLEQLEQKFSKLEQLEQKININSSDNLKTRIDIIESKFNDMCNNPLKLCKITHCMKIN